MSERLAWGHEPIAWVRHETLFPGEKAFRSLEEAYKALGIRRKTLVNCQDGWGLRMEPRTHDIFGRKWEKHS